MSPIYGIVAQDTLTAGSPSSPNTYVASAVHFNGSTVLNKASLTSTNNAFFSFAGWFKTDWTNNTFPTAFLFDPNTQGMPYFASNPGANQVQFFVENDGSGGFHNKSLITPINTSPGNDTGWVNVIGSIDAQSTNSGALYFNDTLADGSVSGATNFNVSTNGLQLLVGGDTFSGDEYIGDMADLSIWPGVSFLTGNDITLTTRRFFRDSLGKPMDPSTYIAQFGTPPVMLKGDATAFPGNALGSGGSFSYYSGTLTNASTHP